MNIEDVMTEFPSPITIDLRRFVDSKNSFRDNVVLGSGERMEGDAHFLYGARALYFSHSLSLETIKTMIRNGVPRGSLPFLLEQCVAINDHFMSFPETEGPLTFHIFIKAKYQVFSFLTALSPSYNVM